MAEIVLKMTSVSKSFPAGNGTSRQVLDGVDLNVSEGEVVGIVGPSGVGKTTLLHMISGFLVPDSGRVSVRQGEKMFYLFQTDAILPWKTVWENTTLAIELGGGVAEVGVIEPILRMLGLYDFRNYYPADLSGGLRRRASLAVALAAGASLVLADEPLSSVDEPTRFGLAILLSNTAKAKGWSMIYVSHSIAEIILVSDRILVMGYDRKGFVAEEAVPSRQLVRSAPFRLDSTEFHLEQRIRELLMKEVNR